MDYVAGDGQQAEGLEQVRACHAFLRAVPILVGLDDTALWQLAQHSRPVTFAAGTTIISEGEETDDFYVVRSGQADVYKRGHDDDDQLVARLAVGSYFGELGLLTNRPRGATIKVRDTGDLSAYAFAAQAFHEIIAEHVLVFRLQREHRKMQRSLQDRRLRIRSIDVLSELPAADLDYVATASEEHSVAAGEPVFYQGDEGDRFYILLSGQVAVERDGEQIASIEPGDFFGETALLFDTPRNATVRATEPSIVWSITRPAFQRVVGHYLLTRHQTNSTILSRLQPVDSER